MMAFDSSSLARPRSREVVRSLAGGSWSDPGHPLRRACEQAAALIESQPDEAALVLDGMLHRILRDWYARWEVLEPEPHLLLAQLERFEPALAWRLRLALRAPNVHVRLAHCRQLLEYLECA
jgi:hypothetical protein